MKKPSSQLAVLLVLVLVPIELACAYLAYETIGEITSMLYFLAVGLNLIFLIVAIWYPRAGALGALLLALAIVPYQLVLGDRLVRVQEEAARIVAYAYEQRLASGEFPSDLEAYEYDDPKMAPYIQRYMLDDSAGGFYLAFRVGTESTSHTYTPNLGWGYYPD
jgi:hypothetical protein